MKIADKVKEALAGADPVWANASAEMVQAILERAMQMTDRELVDFVMFTPAMQKYSGKYPAREFDATKQIIATML
jgi:hypothetical protein